MTEAETHKRQILNRIFMVYAVMLIFGLFIIGKIVRIQFVEAHDLLPGSDDSTSVRYRTIPANRGSVYSADGKLMATSVPVFEIRLDLSKQVVPDEEFRANLDSLALGLHHIFRDRTAEEYRNLLLEGRSENNRYLLIKRRVTYEEMTRVRQLPLLRLGRFKGGLIAEPRDIRVMPYRNLAFRTIGWDREGTSNDVGLEGAYSRELSGVDGVQLVKRLPNGIWRPVTASYLIEPQHGMDIHTTIDMYIQDVAANALMQQLRQSRAYQGCVIVMEVETGHVKAIANLRRSGSDSTFTEVYNQAIAGVYEPGSTFKLATLMAALEDGYVKLSDTVDIGNATHTFYGYEMRDVSRRITGRISVEQAFEVSSNVGIAKTIDMAYRGRADRFSERLQRMRFGQPLGLEIPGEGRPALTTPKDPSWSVLSLPWMSIGYEVTTTPIQLLTFYNAVANNGRMMKPMFVSHITLTGRTVQEFKPQVLQDRIAAPSTISTVQALLERVVDYGTASVIRSNVYKIAGKTGTAKIATGGEGYSSDRYTASFVGYFPADRPRYSCIVVIQEPQGAYYGGQIAAPVFKMISDKLYAGMDDHQHSASFAFRPFTFPRPGKGSAEEQTMVLRRLGLNVADSAHGAPWVAGRPAQEAIILSPVSVNEGVMPDFSGMHLRDVIHLMQRQGVKVLHQGRGRVVLQSPPPGTPVRRDMELRVKLETR